MRTLTVLALILAAPALAEEPDADLPDDAEEAPYDPDADDDPTLPCEVWRMNAENGKRIGRTVVADGEVARVGGRVVARRLDPETVQSVDGTITATWTTDEYGDPFALVTWTPHGLYRSYRFWDDGIFAFELVNGGMQLRYDIMGCDRHELLLGGVGVIWATRKRVERAPRE